MELSYLDQEDSIALTQCEDGEPRGRAREKIPHHLMRYRTMRSRVPPTVAPSNRDRPNRHRASSHESRLPALSRYGPGHRTLLVVCPPSPPRPPSTRHRSARLRRRRAVPRSLRYRFTIGRSIPASRVT